MRDMRAEPTDRVAEGCLWYTQQQAEEALQAAILDTSHPSEAAILDTSHSVEGRDADVSGNDGDDWLNSGDSSAVDNTEVLSRKKRKIENLTMKPDRKWKNPILYKFDGSHSKYTHIV